MLRSPSSGGRRPPSTAEKPHRGFSSVLYARIVPGVPYNLVNYGAGLTAIRLPVFAGATALGA
ncbi:MAG: VTT domain-containing protein, partial [Solirubrobacteraceae bacterium]